MQKFQRIIGIPGLSNLGIVKETEEVDGLGGYTKQPRIYRGAKPENPKGYFSARSALGVNTCVNLETYNNEVNVAAQAGIQVIHFPLTVFSKVSVGEIDQIIETLMDKINQPVLVHCLQGHDRTGMIIACFRMAVDHWSLADALEEMDAYGYQHLWMEMAANVEHYAQAKGFK